MTGLRFGVGCGTLVPPDVEVKLLGRKLFSLSVAEWAYEDVLALRDGAVPFAMPRGGIGNPAATYKAIELELLAFAGDGMIDLIVHSQFALHGFRFALQHPAKVRRIILVNGPFAGADIARWFPAVPCAKGMTPASGFLKALEAEKKVWCRRMRRKRQRNPACHVPEFHFIGLKHDHIVPHLSPYVDMGEFGFRHCIGEAPCPCESREVEWWEVACDPSHFTVISDPEAVAVLGTIMNHEGAWVSSYDHVIDDVPALVAQAA